MNNLLIYDSQYGNTEKVAKVIADSLPSAKLLNINEVNLTDLDDIDLLIIGSPTQGGQATKPIQEFLNEIPENKLNGVKVTTFDTRFLESDLNFALKLLVKSIGFAAPKIMKSLKGKGGEELLPPEGFIVEKTEGPLKKGELERAGKWVKVNYSNKKL